MKHYMKVILDNELTRICYLMDIKTITLSFEKVEWIAIGKIYLCLINKKLSSSNEKDQVLANN